MAVTNKKFIQGFSSRIPIVATYKELNGKVLVKSYVNIEPPTPPPPVATWLMGHKTNTDILEDRRRFSGSDADAVFRAQFLSNTANPVNQFGFKIMFQAGGTLADFKTNTANGITPDAYVPDMIMNDGNYNKAFVKGNYTYKSVGETALKEILDAAWISVITPDRVEAKLLRERVRNVVMSWTARARLQMSNYTLWPIDNNVIAYSSLAHWPFYMNVAVIRRAFMYTCIDRAGETSVYTATQKATAHNMFKHQAIQFIRSHQKNMLAAFPARATKHPKDYAPGNFLAKGSVGDEYRNMLAADPVNDDSKFWSGLRYMGNKEFSGLDFAVDVAIHEGFVWMIDEIELSFLELLYHCTTKNGFLNERHRGAEDATKEAEIGGAYSATSMQFVVAIADKLSRIGRHFMYEAQVTGGVVDAQRGVDMRAAVGNPKSILMIIKQNLLLMTNPSTNLWYGGRETTAVARRGKLLYQCDGKYKDTITDGWRSGHWKSVCQIANMYYKDATLNNYINNPPYAGDQSYGTGSSTSDRNAFSANNSCLVEYWKKDEPFNATWNVNPYHNYLGNTIAGVPVLTGFRFTTW